MKTFINSVATQLLAQNNLRYINKGGISRPCALPRQARALF